MNLAFFYLEIVKAATVDFPPGKFMCNVTHERVNNYDFNARRISKRILSFKTKFLQQNSLQQSDQGTSIS